MSLTELAFWPFVRFDTTVLAALVSFFNRPNDDICVSVDDFLDSFGSQQDD